MLTPKELDAAKQAAPSAKRFEDADYNGHRLIFRNPTRPEYKMYRSVYMQEGKQGDAYESLAQALVVVPSQAEFAAMLEDWPGLASNELVVKALNLLTGAVSQETAK